MSNLDVSQAIATHEAKEEAKENDAWDMVEECNRQIYKLTQKMDEDEFKKFLAYTDY